MANPTTNYGWPMPTSSDLVTDLPADFALFGQPVDTSLKALNPETTLGDIAYRSSTSNTNTRLGIGTSGQVLNVSSGGVPAWTTITTGSMTSIASGSLTGSSVSLTSISGSYKQLKLILTSASLSANGQIVIRFNTDTGNVYNSVGVYAATGNKDTFNGIAGSALILDAYNARNTDTTNSYVLDLLNYTTTTSNKLVTNNSAAFNTDFSSYTSFFGSTNYVSNSAITSIQIIANYSGAYTFDSGTYILYGVN